MTKIFVLYYPRHNTGHFYKPTPLKSSWIPALVMICACEMFWKKYWWPLLLILSLLYSLLRTTTDSSTILNIQIFHVPSSMFHDPWTWISTSFSLIWKQSSAYVVFRCKSRAVLDYRGGIGMIWRLLPHISPHLAKLFRVTLTEIVVRHGTYDMIGTWKHHGFTLWGLSLIFQNVLPRDSERMTSWLADGALEGCQCAHSRTFTIMINSCPETDCTGSWKQRFTAAII